MRPRSPGGGPEGLESGRMSWAAKRCEAAGNHDDLVERRLGLLEPPGEPAHSEALAALTVPECNEGGQLERLA